MPTPPAKRGVALQSPGLRQPVTRTPITTYSYDHRPTSSGGSYPKTYGIMVDSDHADRSVWDAVVVYNRSRARFIDNATPPRLDRGAPVLFSYVGKRTVTPLPLHPRPRILVPHEAEATPLYIAPHTSKHPYYFRSIRLYCRYK
jgi:hypothetical protein